MAITGRELIEAPTVELLSLTDVKANLRVMHNIEDDLIRVMITDAVSYAEESMDRALMEQKWRVMLDSFPASAGAIALPRPKLQSVNSITYTDENGVSQTLILDTDFTLNTTAEPGLIERAYTSGVRPLWPTVRPGTRAVVIQYTCGWDDPDLIPREVISAIKVRISDMYAQRESFVPGRVHEIKSVSENVFTRHRVWFDGPGVW